MKIVRKPKLRRITINTNVSALHEDSTLYTKLEKIWKLCLRLFQLDGRVSYHFTMTISSKKIKPGHPAILKIRNLTCLIGDRLPVTSCRNFPVVTQLTNSPPNQKWKLFWQTLWPIDGTFCVARFFHATRPNVEKTKTIFDDKSFLKKIMKNFIV